LTGSFYYATFRHYFISPAGSQKMLTLQDHEAQASATRQSASRAFTTGRRKRTSSSSKRRGERPRGGGASSAANLGQEQISAPLPRATKGVFHEIRNKVREAAAGCFRQITDVQLSQETELIAAFIDSPAFRDGANQLLFAVETRLCSARCHLPHSRACDRAHQQAAGKAL